MKLLIDNYWSRWTTEYLTQLREYQKIGENSRLIEVGEMVVIFSHELKRNQWKIGKVVKLICGIDNVPILLVQGERCNRYLKRPVTKLYPLETKTIVDVLDNELCNIPDMISDDVTYEDSHYFKSSYAHCSRHRCINPKASWSHLSTIVY